MLPRPMNSYRRLRLVIAATAALAVVLVTGLATPASAQYYYPGYPYYSYSPYYTPYYSYAPYYSYNPYYYPYYAGYPSYYPYYGFPGISVGFGFGGGFRHHRDFR